MYLQSILNYKADTEIEETIKQRVINHIKRYGDQLLTREQQLLHFTVSAFVVNPSFDKVLFIHHNIYNKYCWTGGHTDGEGDFLSVAIKETMEETNIDEVYPLSEDIISIDFLPVQPHYKHGILIEEHQHINVTYPLLAFENCAIKPKLDENSDVKWISISKLTELCGEDPACSIYLNIVNKMNKSINIQNRLHLFSIVHPLLSWFKNNKRVLPWRENKTAYSIWISEIMLQQTRVEAVKQYFIRFMKELPTIESLANVDEDVLLKLWQGLGYYNRARNLKKAAQIIVDSYKGVFPNTYLDIISLPGIGEYTAGSISSIAFGKPYAAIDGNVIRVISRLMELEGDTSKTAFKKDLKNKLEKIYPIHHAGEFTESLMELGATVCLPNTTPICPLCPISSFCSAFKNDTISLFPYKPPKKKRVIEMKTVFIISHNNKFAIQKRGESGLLANLWEFPNMNKQLISVPNNLFKLELFSESIVQIPDCKHIFTHIEWHMKGFYMICKSVPDNNFTWVTKEELLNTYPIPTAFSNFISYIVNEIK